MAKTVIRSCSIVVVMILAACWLTRPLVLGMWDSLYDFQDALYTVWALDHNYQVMGSWRWADYWNAPMLHPYPRSLVLADPHLGTALWTYPAYAITGSAVFAQNVGILGSFVLTGVACYLLACSVTRRRWLALAVGLAAMAIPFRQAQLIHLQVLMTQWLPLSVWCVVECARQPRVRYVVGLGVTTLLTLISALYYGLFQVLLLGPPVIALAWRNRWFRSDRMVRAWVWTTLALAPIAGWFLLPFYVVYRSEGFDRSLWDVVNGSAQPEDFVKVTDRHVLLQLVGFPGGGWVYREIALFPGVTLLLGAALSLYWSARDGAAVGNVLEAGRRLWHWLRRRTDLAIGCIGALLLLCWWLFGVPFQITRLDLAFDHMPVRWRVVSGTFLLLLGVMGLMLVLPGRWRSGWIAQRGLVFWCWVGLISSVMLSFGPLLRVAGEALAIGPYALLYRFVPGFEGMRVPARMCVLFLPLLVLLAAGALDRLVLTLSNHRLWYVGPIVPLSLVVADYAVGPAPWMHLPLDVPPAFRWLKDNGKPGSAFVMPADTIKRQPSPLYLFYATHHRRPMVNGFPAFMPVECENALREVNRFPQQSSLDVLAARGVAYVVVDLEETEAMMGAEVGRQVLDACKTEPRVRRVDAASDDRFVLFELIADVGT